MHLKELTNEEFSNFTNNYKDYSIYQTTEYGLIMNKQKYDSVLLGLVDNNTIMACSLILIENLGHFKYAYAPKGFLLDYNNTELITIFTLEIKKYLKNIGVMAIKINPLIVKNTYINSDSYTNDYYNLIFNNLKSLDYYHLGYNNFFESFKPRFEGIIELNKNIPVMFKNIKKEFKTKIRSSDKNGIRIYKGNEDNLDYLYLQTKAKYPRDLKYFMDVYYYFKKNNMVEFYYSKLDTSVYLRNIQERYQNQSVKCNDITEELFKNQGKENHDLISQKLHEDNLLANLKNELIYATKLLKENPDGIITASALIIKQRDTVNLFMDGFNKKFKKLNSKHLLIWKLIEKYAHEGFKYFNLGGMSNINEPNNKYKGLNDFKMNFGARCIEYIGDLELITNRTSYTMYRNSSPLRNILKK